MGGQSDRHAQTAFGRVLRVHGTPARTGDRKYPDLNYEHIMVI